jgi:hypothetical protein
MTIHLDVAFVFIWIKEHRFAGLTQMLFSRSFLDMALPQSLKFHPDDFMSERCMHIETSADHSNTVRLE